eukprot:361903-Chlamydomonas_euryale.AAC.1
MDPGVWPATWSACSWARAHAPTAPSIVSIEWSPSMPAGLPTRLPVCPPAQAHVPACVHEHAPTCRSPQSLWATPSAALQRLWRPRSGRPRCAASRCSTAVAR